MIAFRERVKCSAVLKKEIYNNIDLSQEIRKILNEQPNLVPEETRKIRTNKSQLIEETK